jgi:alkylation response protein AidB-like acyl-CoA dehydrogenase
MGPMDLQWSDADNAFSDDVRGFLARELTPALREAGRGMTSVYADHAASLEWQRILHARGWAAPAWPKAHGGCDWSVVQHYIFARELVAAHAPPLSPMGLGMCGPVLIEFGTPEQKARFLPAILSGDDYWCQGYSEPQSGSDLASLQMQAVDHGDYFVCNGQKLWTTHAQYANWVFCLVRTSSGSIRQEGITFLLIDMRSPGIEVRPIVFTSGEHIQNELFFRDVRVPKQNVVGTVDRGWSVAKYLMQFERGGKARAPGLRFHLDRLVAMAWSEAGDDGDTLLQDRAFAAKLAQASIDIDGLEAVELQAMSRLSSGEAPSALTASMGKTVGSEISQRLTELAVEAAAFYGAPYQPHVTRPGGGVPGFEPPAAKTSVGPEHSWTVTSKYLNDRAASIYAGTNEIQRNILAKLLGL